ncbi:spore germination protein [Caldicellulosiruptor owensensis OL]|uniref:Spore germination protein n=1 Tax=Caldicellulosiruptor owensensis (strain ATCC 700167 / DSM 13100 / OL) TaxID=632518 RepID=E4Q1B6_CALOW|nr:endospore germination permease [Caldicellulosiruptor owensensis]ADQ05765.1 spore germination protein [Caldicellulosiruptor owensensis OL]
MSNSKISYSQFLCLFFINRIVMVITFLPIFNAPPKNQDVWLSVVFMYPFSVLTSLPLIYLCFQFPNQTFTSMIRIIFGRASIVLSILYIWFFFHITAIQIAQFVEFMATAVLPETPIIFLIVTMFSVCLYALKKGIEPLARFAQIATFITGLSLAVIIIISLKFFDPSSLKPVLEKDIFQPVFGGIYLCSLSSEILTIGMINPYIVKNKNCILKDMTRTIILAFLLVDIFYFAITVLVLSLFGYPQASKLSFPFYSAIKVLSVADFLERFESLHMAIWIMGIFLKITYFMYILLIAVQELRNTADYFVYAIPFICIIVPFVFYIIPDFISLDRFMSYRYFTFYSLIFIFFIPLFTLISAKIKLRLRKK